MTTLCLVSFPVDMHLCLCINIYVEKATAPSPVLLPGKSHGRRSLVGCSPWGHWGSDTTERFHVQFSLSCIGEGNGNPLQCSCLENPRDGGAWWAAVYGVAQSRTQLKWLKQQQHKYLWNLRILEYKVKEDKNLLSNDYFKVIVIFYHSVLYVWNSQLQCIICLFRANQ